MEQASGPSCSPPPYSAFNTSDPHSHWDDLSQFQGGYVSFQMLKDTRAREWKYGFPYDNQWVADTVPWFAILRLFVKDVSQIMSNGLHLSSENIDPSGACLSNEGIYLTPYRRSIGWTHFRRYTLRDVGENPQWKGLLVVLSGGIKELSQFRIDTLSANNVRFAGAYNANQEKVYNFDCINKDNNFNIIFDDMPMQRWWPWPKPKAKQSEKYKAVKALTLENVDSSSRSASLQQQEQHESAEENWYSVCGFRILF
ncbi:hypothetical protein QQS21_006331 [Conoideocrella luteorostrata]|uniref:Uncharacterized protein n=1 Tax=Conoideocrella luteorostrata TaxID=1105319 RepID=A0AAJ0CS12_9HYPO|nr:hypothetical protein QQS21_006331 [Conoideocrella luteorostrata]